MTPSDAHLEPIDTDRWARREHFEHYRRRVPCSYEMTVELDATRFVETVRRAGVRTYPAQLWAISTVVNRHPEFRMQLLPDGSPAVWDVVHPEFTVFHPETETFSGLVVRHDADFRRFHDDAVATIAEHRHDTRMFPQQDRPRNVFDVSSLPWTSFTGFALHIADGWDHLLPIITLGRYRTVGDRVLLPMALQVNHAAADGFHAARLVREVEELLVDPDWIAP